MGYAIASDLSYRVLQERRRRGELTLPEPDQGRQLAHRPVIRFWDAGEGQLVFDDRTPDEVTPTWHFRGGRK